LGCGQGEFLRALNHVTGAQCLGFDPAYRNEPLPSGIRLEPNLMPQDFGEEFDLFVCRMTLEHLQEPGRVLDWIGALRGGHGAVLFATVPSAEYIWLEGAFWDLYYEHVNYFTPDSIKSALESRGYADVEISAKFGRQYLEIIANFPNTRGDSPSTQPTRLVSLTDIQRRLTQNVQAWRHAFVKWTKDGKKVVIWGGASKTVAFYNAVPEAQCAITVDINPRRHGKFLPESGAQIRDPQTLVAEQPDVVIAMNPNYLGEIQKDLDDMGIYPAFHAINRPPRHQTD
jgi:hypothetical protein